MHSVGDLVMCLCDTNGHVGRHIEGVHGRYGVGQMNLEGLMNVIKVLSGEGIMCVRYIN